MMLNLISSDRSAFIAVPSSLVSGSKLWWAVVGAVIALALTIHNRSMRALVQQCTSVLLPYPLWVASNES